MAAVRIITDGQAWQQAAVDALRQAIAADGSAVADAAALADYLCPLTLNLPESIDFPGQAVFQTCRDLNRLRDRVHSFGYAIGLGTHWLPIVHTAKGTLYAEAITTVADGYQQPLHLSDRLRQPLYALGQRLMRDQFAPPAVYLLQFGCIETDIRFDRLWPFPAAPALASLGVQTPNLYECHWRCLSHQPIVDLAIAGELNYVTL